MHTFDVHRNEFLSFLIGAAAHDFYLAASELNYSVIGLSQMFGCSKFQIMQMRSSAIDCSEVRVKIKKVLNPRPVTNTSFEEIAKHARSKQGKHDWSDSSSMHQIFKAWARVS